jgi:hypothetical protein
MIEGVIGLKPVNYFVSRYSNLHKKIPNFSFMRTITIESTGILSEELQTEVHHAFGMEHYTDYVFKPKGDKNYSATIVFEDSRKVIRNVEERSADFPDHQFEIEDLDMESGVMKIYTIQGGCITKIRSR